MKFKAARPVARLPMSRFLADEAALALRLSTWREECDNPVMTSDLPPFPDQGVSLSFLRYFMKVNIDRLGLNTEDVAQSIPEDFAELVVRVNRLRKIPWKNEAKLAEQIDSKLKAIGVSTPTALREALATDQGHTINQQLKDVGKSTFGTETMQALATVLRVSQDTNTQQCITTSDVCSMIVRPDTTHVGAMVDLLRERPPDNMPSSAFVGQATHFVSHTWSYRFSDLVEGVEAFAQRQLAEFEEHAFFWIDIFR